MSQREERLPEVVFLLSLPRSGSTLLQRMLATHPQISTVAEPWMLLPQVYPFVRKDLYASYRSVDFRAAAKDFFATLPESARTYWQEVDRFIRRVYGILGGEARYFLDKTPRYSLIAPHLASLFPESKFVFLFRNPLAIIASINQVWGGGRWKIYTYKVDLFMGLENLLLAYESLLQEGRCIGIRYEDLLMEPEPVIARVCDYLKLPKELVDIQAFSQVQISGVMGDPKREVLQRLSQKPLTAWRETEWNPFRKIWARHYLHWIGEKRLALMGYDLNSLLKDLNDVPLTPRYLLSDIVRFIAGGVYNFAQPVIFRDILYKVPAYHEICALR